MTKEVNTFQSIICKGDKYIRQDKQNESLRVSLDETPTRSSSPLNRVCAVWLPVNHPPYYPLLFLLPPHDITEQLGTMVSKSAPLHCLSLHHQTLNGAAARQPRLSRKQHLKELKSFYSVSFFFFFFTTTTNEMYKMHVSNKKHYLPTTKETHA